MQSTCPKAGVNHVMFSFVRVNGREGYSEEEKGCGEGRERRKRTIRPPNVSDRSTPLLKTNED